MENDQLLMQIRRRIAVAAAILSLAIGLAGQTRPNVNKLKEQRRTMDRKMKTTHRKLNETKRTARISSERLAELTRQVAERKQMIDRLNRDLAAIDRRINDANAELKRLETQLTKRKSQYATLLRALHERCSIQNKWIFLLSADNFAHFLRRVRYLHEYASWQKRQALTIVDRQQEIDDKRTDLANIRSEKSDLLAVRATEYRRLKNEESEQRTGVRQLATRQADLNRELIQQQQQAATLDRRIEQLAAEDFAEKKKDEQRRKSKSPNRKPDAATTKQNRKLSDEFAANRGRLPFPLNGRYKVVESFGRHRHKRWTYVRTTNNGIDIRTTKGTDARAVFNGTVTRVFVLPGYNYNVIIRHGKYLTVYSNLGKVYVKAGDRVTTRQNIGRIYSDSENRDETVLHFQLWREKRKLNPLTWLD